MITTKWFQGGKTSIPKRKVMQFILQLRVGMETEVPLIEIKDAKYADALERQINNDLVMHIWDKVYGDLRQEVSELGSLAQSLAKTNEEKNEVLELVNRINDMFKGPKNESLGHAEVNPSQS